MRRRQLGHRFAIKSSLLVALLLLTRPSDALKLRISGLHGKECVSQEIARKSSYVTGSFVSLPGAGLPDLLGGRASYDLQVRTAPPAHAALKRLQRFCMRKAEPYKLCRWARTVHPGFELPICEHALRQYASGSQCGNVGGALPRRCSTLRAGSSTQSRIRLRRSSASRPDTSATTSFACRCRRTWLWRC